VLQAKLQQSLSAIAMHFWKIIDLSDTSFGSNVDHQFWMALMPLISRPF